MRKQKERTDKKVKGKLPDIRLVTNKKHNSKLARGSNKAKEEITCTKGNNRQRGDNLL